MSLSWIHKKNAKHCLCGHDLGREWRGFRGRCQVLVWSVAWDLMMMGYDWGRC